jgi:hypothetical protein
VARRMLGRPRRPRGRICRCLSRSNEGPGTTGDAGGRQPEVLADHLSSRAVSTNGVG